MTEEYDLTRRSRQTGEGTGIAVLLACVGGLVDAVGYLTLHHIFIGVMSGNSIVMGLRFAGGDWRGGLMHLSAIVLFVLGVAVGVIVMEVTSRRRARAPMAGVLGLEILLVAAYMVWGDRFVSEGSFPRVGDGTWKFVLLVALLALPMGMQTAALQRVGGHSVHTTFVTGMLTQVAKESARGLFWLHDRVFGGTMSWRAKQEGILPREPSGGRWLMYTGIWLAYVAGAIGGAAGLRAIGTYTLAVALGILSGAMIMVLLRPLGPQRR